MVGENSQANLKQKKSVSNGQKTLTSAGASALIVLEELTERKSPRQMSGLELNLFSIYLKKYQEAQSSSMEDLLHDPLLPASIREQIYETLKQKEKDSAQDSAVYYKQQMEQEQLEAQRAYEEALQAYHQALARLSVAQQEHEQAVQELKTAKAEDEVATQAVTMAEKNEQSAQQNEQKERDKWVDNLEAMYNSGDRQKAIKLAAKTGVGEAFAKKVEGLSTAEKEILSNSKKQPLTPADLENLSPEERADYKKLANARRTTEQASKDKAQAKQKKEKTAKKRKQAEQKKTQTDKNLDEAKTAVERAQENVEKASKTVDEQTSSTPPPGMNCASILAKNAQSIEDSSPSMSDITNSNKTR